jgi:hypothetical protein
MDTPHKTSEILVKEVNASNKTFLQIRGRGSFSNINNAPLIVTKSQNDNRPFLFIQESNDV